MCRLIRIVFIGFHVYFHGLGCENGYGMRIDGNVNIKVELGKIWSTSVYNEIRELLDKSKNYGKVK